MVYPNLKFPKVSGRPFFYTNFVATLDGKVWVKKWGYWPIGSRIDYQTLLELRAYADCLIHGKNLALQFGRQTLESINKKTFKKLRKRVGSNPNLPYYIVTSHPQAVSSLGANVFHLPGGNLQVLVKHLKQKGYKHVLIEGGPNLLGSFLKENLLDEIFLTIAPKIFGSDRENTLTLVEGYLFPPDKIKKLKLLSVKQIENELFLHYRILN